MDDHYHMQRMLASVHEQMHGKNAGTYWYAPGAVTLLDAGDQSVSAPMQFGATVAVEPRDDAVVDLRWVYRPLQSDRIRLTDLEPGTAAAREPLAVIWALQAAGHALGGAAVTVHTDVPRGVGTSMSVAIACATGFSLRNCYRLDVSDESMFEIVCAGLQAFEVPGVTIGAVAASILACDGEAIALDRAPSRLPFGIAHAGMRLLVVDTGVRRDLPPEQPVAGTSELDGVRVALERNDFREFGAIMTRSHDAGSTSIEQQVAATAALSAGAFGARATVDGAGRPIVVLVPAAEVATVRRAVAAAYADRGWRQPRFLTSSTVETARAA
ncbi:hypothetical protein [Antrihabitans sp. YC2-6]|uniref:GHMP family kinase ATP-binding protein n=1 Tax=Antrihabitans sp. YC2-6 TaxID=2799498 RepID=UPI0018F61520|nr:hypothetical protein [Antrihabitans sp. YC2-6]MBJ8348321.1 hypothetical protein [Antrihabitans sp. YC2-6]